MATDSWTWHCFNNSYLAAARPVRSLRWRHSLRVGAGLSPGALSPAPHRRRAPAAVSPARALQSPGFSQDGTVSSFVSYFKNPLAFKAMLHWSTCNANLQWCDVARNCSSVTSRCGRFFFFGDICTAATRWKFLKAIKRVKMSANLCEKHALRIGVASWPV